MKPTAFFWALMLLVQGCGGSELGHHRSAILKGTKATHPLVGKLSTPLGSCSATLIRPYYALTTAHCVAEMGETAPVGGMIYLYLDGEEHPTHSAGVTIHPDFANNKDKDLTTVEAFVEADLAVVSFEHEVRPDIDVPLAAQAPVVEQPVVLWGLGKDESGWSGTSYKADNEVAEVYDTFYLMFAYEPRFGMIQQGDSGGPTFDPQGTLIGVHSGIITGEFSFDGSPPRSSTGWEAKDLRVDVFRGWVERQLYEPELQECAEWDCQGKYDASDGGIDAGAGCSIVIGAGPACPASWPLLVGLLALLLVRSRRR